MKKIVPFVKELNFKTKVSEITSISLEHNITLKESDLISGVFHISGDYKMTEGSINREKFTFNLPFDIALDSRYDTNNCVIDIDNFYYEIINNDILKVNIDLYIEGELIKEEQLARDIVTEIPPVITSEEKNIETDNVEESKAPEITKEQGRILDDEIDTNITINNVNTNTNSNNNVNTNKEDLFSNLDNNETYATYHVYIVKEDDTIDKILNKYNITKEDLENYNDISNISMGDKLVIPSING